MIYQLAKDSLIPAALPQSGDDDCYLGVTDKKGAPDLGQSFGFSLRLLKKSLENDAVRFEGYLNTDMVCVTIVTLEKLNLDSPTIHIFASEQRLLMVCDEVQFVAEMLTSVSAFDEGNLTFGRLLFHFFDQLSKDDVDYLENLEDEIMAMEQDIIKERNDGDYVSRITDYRRRLVFLKRHYEQMGDVLKYLELNENKVFDKASLRLLKIFSGKLDRLLRNVEALIEYVAQIREAYQSEVDIQLNETMKVFTVITTIFFPLTLIAGWYGMNFPMPEYESALGYPMVILLSLGVIVVSIFFFKKKKWF